MKRDMGEMGEETLIGNGKGRSIIGRVTVNKTKDVWKKPSEVILFIYLKLYSIHISLCVYIYSLKEVIPLGLRILPLSPPRAVDYLTKTQIPGMRNSL